MSAEEALAPTSRHQYKLPDGRVAYEWSQSLDDVTVFVLVPPGVRGKDLDVRIENRRCTLGIRGNPPYLDHETYSVVKASESFWTLEDGTLHLHLTKADPGEPWASAFAGHEGGAAAAGAASTSTSTTAAGSAPSASASVPADDTARLLLERFQREHPGFDFSGAQLSGPAPDPRTFLKDLPEGEKE